MYDCTDESLHRKHLLTKQHAANVRTQWCGFRGAGVTQTKIKWQNKNTPEVFPLQTQLNMKVPGDTSVVGEQVQTSSSSQLLPLAHTDPLCPPCDCISVCPLGLCERLEMESHTMSLGQSCKYPVSHHSIQMCERSGGFFSSSASDFCTPTLRKHFWATQKESLTCILLVDDGWMWLVVRTSEEQQWFAYTHTHTPENQIQNKTLSQPQHVHLPAFE